jgi:hypothetical protein
VLADDHHIVRQGLCAPLERDQIPYSVEKFTLEKPV